MRIRFLVMNAYAVGGTIRSVFTTAGALAARGHEVEVISVYRWRSKPVLPLHPDVRLRPLTDLRLARASKRRLSRYSVRRCAHVLAHRHPSRLIDRGDLKYANFSVLTDIKLLRFLRSVDGGILVGTRPGLNLAVARFARPSVVTVGQDHMNLRSYRGRLRRAIQQDYRRLRAVTTLTERDAESYRELLNGSVRVEAIPNAVPSLGAHRSDLESKVVVAAGGLRWQKGFDRLVPAWAEVARRHPDWELRIFGDGRLQDELQEMIESLGAQRVRLMGFTPDLAKELAGASLYVMTSRFEGFPMVLLEAMSVGLPTVSYDIRTGPRELIGEGVAGHVVPNGDASALVEAMSDVMSDPDKRRRYGAAALERAGQYGADAMAGRWETLFGELSETEAPGGRLEAEARTLRELAKAWRRSDLTLAAADDAPTIKYLTFLRRVHDALLPKRYLEIGVRHGDSLALAKGVSVGIDPAYEIQADLPPRAILFRETSDEYFSRPDPLEPFGGQPPELAFIDGMHLAEFALRDFINVERHASWSTVVIFDDILPRSEEEAARERTTKAWTGDVYKILGILARHRPDLICLRVGTRPTGLLLVLGLDPDSRVLSNRYDEIACAAVHPDLQSLPRDVSQRHWVFDPDAVLAASFWSVLREAADGEMPRSQGIPALRKAVRRDFGRRGPGPIRRRRLGVSRAANPLLGRPRP